MKRKGMGAGKGKGYQNLAGRDPKIHSDSSKGRKQPQKIGVIIPSKADMPVTEIQFDPTVEEKGVKTSKTQKVKAFAFKKFEQGKSFTESKLERLKKKREQKKIEELEEINHPLVTKVERQRGRVETLKTQIAENDDDNKEDKLFTELGKEQEQLREAQEKITNLKVVDLSDRELKTLSIRWKDDSVFGSNNPYVAELKRRIRAEKTIEKELEEERNKKEEGSIFDF